MKNIYILLTILLFYSCKPKEEVLPDSIDPANSDLLSKFITLEDGANRGNGQLPNPDSEIFISGLNGDYVTSNGSTLSIILKVGSQDISSISGYYFNIEGSDIFYKVPLSNIGSDGTITIPVGLPGVLEAGNFCINLMTYDSNNRTSNLVQQCVGVIRLGSGSLQVNLAWNTNESDIDLYVQDPDGETIYYLNDNSLSGGYLDRDDTNGFGPENIFWEGNAPDGDYLVYIDYYGDDETYYGKATECYVTVTHAKGSKSFKYVLNSVGDYSFVTKIRKSGDNITFLQDQNALIQMPNARLKTKKK